MQNFFSLSMKIGFIVLENSACGKEKNHDKAFTSIKFTRAKFCDSGYQTQ